MNDWVSVAQASHALGVSEKTVWRRAKAGRLNARKVAGGRGGFVWEIALSSTGQPTDRPDKTDRTPTGQKESASAVLSVKPTGQPDKIERPTDRTPTGQNDEITMRLLSQLEGENAFLRGVIEQLQRDGAETRAALRKALENAPKQLEQGRAPDTQQQPVEREEQGDEMDAAELLELCRRIAQ